MGIPADGGYQTGYTGEVELLGEVVGRGLKDS